MAQRKARPPVSSKSEAHLLSWRKRVYNALSTPVDAAGLVYIRIAFGIFMLWETVQFITRDWAGRHFSSEHFHFTYWPFDFVHPWPGVGIHIHLYGMAVAAICIILGLFYRVSTTVFFCMITYVFLLDQSFYLNHFYLFCLLAFLLILVPAHRYLSLDAMRQSDLRQRDVPTWSLWLLRFQVGVVYFYGGIAKLNKDWFHGEPLRQWLAQRTDFPLLGPLFTNDAVVWGMTYGALCLDLLVVFLLINRRTRVFGYIAALLFHFMNARLFTIEVFPWMMIALTAVFFEPDWPRQVVRALKEGGLLRRLALIGAGGLGFAMGALIPKHFSWLYALTGALGCIIAVHHLDEPFRHPAHEVVQTPPQKVGARRRAAREGYPRQPWLLVVCGVWVVAHILIPLRHFVIPGNVNWTDEGRRFSWHMLTRNKTGGGFFVISDPATGEKRYVDPQKYLNRRQHRKMITRPDMIVQFARFLEERMRRQGHRDLEVRADILVSLNGREAQQFIDSDIDLTTVPYPWWGHAEWIRPLSVPLYER